MSLLSVLSNARSSLSVTSQQTAVVSRNVANAQDPSATRKYANSIYTRPGAVEIRSISQSSDPALYRTLINAQSSLGTNETIADALDRLRDVIGDVDSPTSPSSSLAALKDALTDLAASPESAQLQRAAVDKAKAMTASLNTASDAVQAMRKDADTELKQSADAMRKLLSDLESVNNGVVVGTRSGNDVTDLVDRRDQIVAEISKYVGVSVRSRGDNDIILTTDSGIVMFDKMPRSIEFSPTSSFDPSIRMDNATAARRPGAFKIDGVDISANGSMPVRSGSLQGLLQVRDEMGPEFQEKLDMMARGLVTQFTESGGPGLFQSASGTDPITARSIMVAARVDYAVGGDAKLLRDGAVNAASTSPNTAGDSGYSQWLNTLVGKVTSPLDLRPYDWSSATPGTFGTGQNSSLVDFSAASIAWLEGKRSDATEGSSYQKIMVARAQETLSNSTGINLDEEMTRLLDLERSFQASTKLIATVGEMLDQLINIA